MKRKIIIDTDPGIDDAMAIMLAIKCGIFDICAITTVCGNSTIYNTTRNAKYILNLLDANFIPLFSGAQKPLKRPLIQADIHGKSGLAGINPKNIPLLTNNAVDKIISIVKNNPNKLTLVALGPLTNIAEAILKSPNVMIKIKEIIIMGGTINTPGNKSGVAEFNIFVDPEAASIVFSFPIKKALVPLDACNNVALSIADFEKINNKKLKTVLLKMVKPYVNKLVQENGSKKAIMYDPLTIYYLINKKAASTYSLPILIETKSVLARGMTVIDSSQDCARNNTVIVNSIDADVFKNDFIKIISKD
jgi:purine nucleosidase